MSPKRFFFIMLGGLVVLTITGGVGYYFALKTVTSARMELAAVLGEQATAEQQLSELQTLRVSYNRDIVPVLPLIDGALPRTKNQTEILAQLQAVASGAGLQLSGVTLPSAVGLPNATSQTVKAGTLLALPVTFQLQGTYAQLQAFLVRVENLNRFTNVTSLAVSHGDKVNAITYSMTVNAYVKP